MPLAMGDLVHQTLDRALRTLEANGGLAAATAQQIASAVDGAAGEVAETWETERRCAAARDLATHPRRRAGAESASARLWRRAPARCPFLRRGPLRRRRAQDRCSAALGRHRRVEIPGTGFRIAGYIDRLDISGDGRRALVRDYKTGRKPKDTIVLDGGKELQRCLYAFAVKAMLGDDVTISASLLYPRDEVDLRLEDPEGTLVEVAGYLRAARASLLAGDAVIGADTGGTYDDLAFALPANAGATYCKRKIAAATERLGDAAQVWEAQ